MVHTFEKALAWKQNRIDWKICHMSLQLESTDPGEFKVGLSTRYLKAYNNPLLLIKYIKSRIFFKL